MPFPRRALFPITCEGELNMIFLLSAIAANTVMTFVMRYSETHSGNRYAVTMFNYLTGIIISFLTLGNKTLYFPTPEGRFALGLALVNAVLFVGCLLCIQYNINKNGAPLATTFNRLGILIPTIASVFLFHEIPKTVQTVGLAFAVFAIIYINGGKKTKEESVEGGAAAGKTSSAAALILLFVLGGCVDLTSKVYGVFGDSSLQEHFVFYTFVYSFAMSVGLLLWKNRRISLKDVLAGVLVGIPNQLTALCLLKAVALLPAFLVYPVYSAAVILVVNVINLAVFREKLSRREYQATGIIALALVLINL